MATLEQLRKDVWAANIGIYRGGLVTMHSGNASGIDRKRGLVIIKPSGMDYEKLRPAPFPERSRLKSSCKPASRFKSAQADGCKENCVQPPRPRTPKGCPCRKLKA